MSDLKSLIRVRKHTVEQKQKAVSALYREAEHLENQKVELLGTLDQEQEKIQELGVEMLSYFGPYSKAVKERVANIDVEARQLEARIEVAREDMRIAYNELKKIEITQERREDEAEKVRNKKEAQDLDEIALEGFRRQQAD